VFQAFSAACTFWIAVSRVNGGKGGRLSVITPFWRPFNVAAMDFALSEKGQDYHKRLTDFMTEFVFPAEKDYDAYRHEKGPDDHTVPPVIEDLKKLAKERGLWNLFLPSESGLTNLEYAPLAELTGWSMEIAPEATGARPPTPGTETLHLFANERRASSGSTPAER
jgi:acyl-CoA dehydrogenase